MTIARNDSPTKIKLRRGDRIRGIKKFKVKMIEVKIIKNGDRITGCTGLTGK